MASIAVVAILAVFAAGAVLGVIVLVSLAVRREDRRFSLEDHTGSARGAPAVRRLTAFHRGAYPPYPRRYALGSVAD